MLNPFQRRGDPHMLVVSMTGVKMGDRLVHIGCANGGRLAAIAGKVGLSGHAVAVVENEAAAARARKAAAEAGVLVQVEIARPVRLPLDADGFDLAVVDDTQGLFGALATRDRTAAVGEVFRIVRPGGRAIVLGAGARSGLGALLERRPQAPSLDANAALKTSGFRSVRTLAEREGLIFVEGIKPRDVTART